jgi:hypothetical protein
VVAECETAAVPYITNNLENLFAWDMVSCEYVIAKILKKE